jgi:hypothetical protein
MSIRSDKAAARAAELLKVELQGHRDGIAAKVKLLLTGLSPDSRQTKVLEQILLNVFSPLVGLEEEEELELLRGVNHWVNVVNNTRIDRDQAQASLKTARAELRELQQRFDSYKEGVRDAGAKRPDLREYGFFPYFR